MSKERKKKVNAKNKERNIDPKKVRTKEKSS